MRKLLCLALFLLLLLQPALAEEAPAVPDWAVGEWKAVLTISGAQMQTWQDENAPRLLITEDGWLTFPQEGAPRYALTCDTETDEWSVSNPETGEKLMLHRSWYPGHLVFGIDTNHQTYYIRKDASPVQLSPSTTTSLTYGGDWEVCALYVWSETDTESFLTYVDFSHDLFEDRYIAPLTITLPPFPSFETIQKVWKDAVSQTADDCPLRALEEIYGYELRSRKYVDTLLLETRYGLLMLQCERTAENDAAFQEKIDGLAGWWYPDELSVGGIYLPASAMDIPDDPIAIDRQGNVLLPDGTVTALRLEEDTLLLGEYPISGGSTLTLTLADGVELDWISENDWYRKQLNGDWQLSEIAVPSLDMHCRIDPAVTDVTLNIDSSDYCAMDSDTYRLYDPRFDVTEYWLSALYNDDAYTLTITGPDTVLVTPDSDSYTLTFTRIEETEE